MDLLQRQIDYSDELHSLQAVVSEMPELRHSCIRYHALFNILGYSTIELSNPVHWLAEQAFLRHTSVMNCHFK